MKWLVVFFTALLTVLVFGLPSNVVAQAFPGPQDDLTQPVIPAVVQNTTHQPAITNPVSPVNQSPVAIPATSNRGINNIIAQQTLHSQYMISAYQNLNFPDRLAHRTDVQDVIKKFILKRAWAPATSSVVGPLDSNFPIFITSVSAANPISTLNSGYQLYKDVVNTGAAGATIISPPLIGASYQAHNNNVTIGVNRTTIVPSAYVDVGNATIAQPPRVLVHHHYNQTLELTRDQRGALLANPAFLFDSSRPFVQSTHTRTIPAKIYTPSSQALKNSLPRYNSVTLPKKYYRPSPTIRTLPTIGSLPTLGGYRSIPLTLPKTTTSMPSSMSSYHSSTSLSTQSLARFK